MSVRGRVSDAFTGVRVFLQRLADMAMRRSRDARLDEDVEAHLQLLADEYVSHGMTQEEARRAARREFGNVEALKDVYRDQRGLPFLDAMAQDIRFALRLLHRERGFAVTAILVLATGIGVNNLLFTILNAHTLRGLPLPDADRVVSVTTVDSRGGARGLSVAEFEDVRDGARCFAGLVGLASAPVVISGDGRTAERVEAAFLSGDPFAIAAGQPIVGRAFAAAESRAGGPAAVLIGATLWRSRYGADSGVLGHSILVNGAPATIVGVIDEQSGLPTTAGLWMPLIHLPEVAALTRSDRVLDVLGRLRDEISITEADAEIQAIALRLGRDHPDTNAGVRARVLPINEQYLARWNEPVWFMFMTVGFLVVLISCANVANLLLARAVIRSREIAIRSSLGATRRRIVRQLLIEGTVLAAAGGALGLAFATLGVRLMEAAIPEGTLPYWLEYSADRRVLAALVGVSAGAVLLFALIPAIQTSRTDVYRVLKDGGRAGPGGRAARRWTTAFVAAEFALAIVLIAQVVVAARSSRPSLPSDDVIDTPKVLTASLALTSARYRTPAQRVELHRRLRERLAGVAGVTSASMASVLPLSAANDMEVLVAGRPFTDPAQRPSVKSLALGPAYFQTLGLAVSRGREFVESDQDGAQSPTIVNDAFVRRFFADVDPIGQLVTVGLKTKPDATPRTLMVVGVAPAVRQGRNPDGDPIVYVPYASDPVPNGSLLIRGSDDAAALTPQVKEAVAALDSDLPLYRVLTMEDVMWNARWNGRLSHRLILTLTLIAAGLCTVGLYAVAMQAVRQRTAEIGVRMALGAKPRHIATMIVRRALVQLAFGFVAGVVCVRLWAGQAPPGGSEPRATDVQTLLIVAAILLALAAIACVVPARRATRLDPVAAVRHE